MHQIANHWTILITFTRQCKHFKVFSYIKCPLQQQRGIKYWCQIQTDIWGRVFKVCLALTCLFPTPLSVMFVLYCHTTRLEDLCWRAISTDIYKSYTQSHTEKGSNTRHHRCSFAVMHLHTLGNTAFVVWWDREVTHAVSLSPSTAHTNTCARAKNSSNALVSSCLLGIAEM